MGDEFMHTSQMTNDMKVLDHLQAMSDYTVVTKYARYDEKKGRRETWDEMIDRVRDMHKFRYGTRGVNDDIDWAFEQVRDRRVLPSMRSLQYGGEAVISNDARIYNCSFSLADRPRFFSECLWLLLSGVGTGFSVQKQHVEKLPKLIKYADSTEKEVMTYTIGDTIEGWADALQVLIDSFFVGTPLSGKEVFFDYTKIRRKGSKLRTSGGRAPGPKPLQKAIKRIKRILLDAVDNKQDKLRPIQVYDIVMMAADCVLAGGVRRSATISLFSPDDEEMMNAKIEFHQDVEILTDRRKDGTWITDVGVAYNLYNNDGSDPVKGDKCDIGWYNLYPWRQLSNNSVALLRNECKFEDFQRVINCAKSYGEPGFVFLDNRDYGYNPCSEIGLNPVDPKTGQTGWQACVSGDTDLIIKSGRVKIGEAIGDEVEIWNGSQWSKVSPRITGHNRKLHRVKFNDGSYLDCTDNHKFLVADRFDKDYSVVQTKNLMSYSKYDIHVPRSNIKYDNCGGHYEMNAYEYGFLFGDGSVCVKNYTGKVYAEAGLYGKKINLPLHGDRKNIFRPENYNVDCQNISFTDLDTELCKELKNFDVGLPNSIFEWNHDSIINFVSGWADADGSAHNKGCRIYGAELKIRDLQLLLTKVGINSSVCLMSKKGEETNLGVRSRDVWYVYIPDARKLNVNRFDVSNGQSASHKAKWQIVKSVEELPGYHTTYCLDEPVNHTCVFNNVLTKQCNLTEINGRAIKSKDDFKLSVKAATIIGTLQAGYTYFNYLSDASRNIIRREALLGVSVTGWMDNPDLLLNPEIQQEMAKYAIEVNKEFAEKIGINPAARVTCTKPAGTTSIVLGTGSGIHPHHARRYFRRVRFNKNERPAQYFKMNNPHMVEPSVSNENDEIITFCIQVPESAILKKDLGAIDFLKMVKSTFENWVLPGTADEKSSPGLTHNVSNTVTIKADEWGEAAKFIYENRNCFSGISMLADFGDKLYNQAPMERVETEEDLKKWKELTEKYKHVDWSKFSELEDYTSRQLNLACSGGSCELVF